MKQQLAEYGLQQHFRRRYKYIFIGRRSRNNESHEKSQTNDLTNNKRMNEFITNE